MKNKLKIAFIPSTFLPIVGGAEIQTHNTANKMAELGNDIDIFLLEKNKIENKKYNIIKLNKLLINLIFISIYYFKLNLIFLLEYYFKKICAKKNYDVNFVIKVPKKSYDVIIIAVPHSLFIDLGKNNFEEYSKSNHTSFF